MGGPVGYNEPGDEQIHPWRYPPGHKTKVTPEYQAEIDSYLRQRPAAIMEGYAAGVGAFGDRDTGGCGTTDTPGCVMYADGTCSCARNAGVSGACSSCAQKMGMAGCDCAQCTGIAAPPHGGHGGHHHHGRHFRGGHRIIGGRRFFDWPRWWGPTIFVEPASCAWIPPTGRVPPSVIAALARQPFVNGWRTVFDSGWWAEQQNPNQYFVCVVADNIAAGLGADVPALEDVRRRAVETAYPDRDVGGWDIWASDPKVEPIWVQFMAPYGYDAAHAEKVRMYAAGTPKTDPTATVQPMSIWPMVAVGVVAIGIFVATLAISPKR